MEVISSYKISDDEDTFPPKQNSAFIIDLMALIRTVSPIPSTYGQLVRKLVDYLPKGYRRVDIIADTYRECSLKSNEQHSRGVSDKVIVASASSKIPRNFTDFLKNGENKTSIIELIKEEFIKNSKDYLDVLKSDMIIFP